MRVFVATRHVYLPRDLSFQIQRYLGLVWQHKPPRSNSGDIPVCLAGLLGSGVDDMIICNISRLHCIFLANRPLRIYLPYLVAFDKVIIQGLASCTQCYIALLGPSKPRMQVVQTMLDVLKPCLTAI